jgi:ATP-dependent Clp protease ATP-binding subunit ClpA
MTVEHLLLALLDNPSAAGVLRACGADLNKLAPNSRASSPRPCRCCRATTPATPSPRSASSACCSARCTTCSRRPEGSHGANVLVAIFGEKDSHAVYFLNQQDIARLDVVNYISHGIAKIGRTNEESRKADANRTKEGEGGEEGKGNPLTEFATNLNEQARRARSIP